MLTRLGVPLHAPGTLSKDARWFRAYLKREDASPHDCDFKAFEKQHRIRVPKTYKDFITRFGGRTLAGVDAETTDTVRVLMPQELDIANYRKGAMETTDEDSARVDGIMFAETGDGDGYCFDLASAAKEPPVVRFVHEGFYFEPSATNFVEFLRRWCD